MGGWAACSATKAKRIVFNISTKPQMKQGYLKPEKSQQNGDHLQYAQEEQMSMQGNAEDYQDGVVVAGKQKYCQLALLSCVALLVLISLLYFQITSISQCAFQGSKQFAAIPFRKVLWLYTENELEAESMHYVIYLHHFNETFLNYGYEVLQVNSWTAYDYLTNQTAQRITKAMQNSKIDEGVDNLLRLALLAEHGGVMINNFDSVFPHNDSSWIEGLFNSSAASPDNYLLPPEQAQIFLFRFQKDPKRHDHSASFIAARPQSTLVLQAFEALLTLISTGDYSYVQEQGILGTNAQTQVDYLLGGIDSALNLVLYKQQQEASNLSFCSYFRIQSFRQQNYLLMSQLSQSLQESIIFKQGYQQTLSKVSKHPVYIIMRVNRPRVIAFVQAAATNIHLRDPDPLPQNSLIYKLLSAPNNRQVFIDKLPKRQIEFCLIFMETLTKSKINLMRNSLAKQTYKNYKLVIPSDQELNQTASSNLHIIKPQNNNVRLIEKACTKYCHPRSFAVLLNFGDSFSTPKALEQIAKVLQPRDVIGTFIGLELNGSLQVTEAMHFHRAMEGIVDPNYQKMEKILNHFRIFSVEHFRFIPQFDLRNYHGKYFQDRLIFLMTLLELVYAYAGEPQIHYLGRKYAHLFNYPGAVTTLPRSVYLKVLKKESMNREQVRMTRARLECESFRDTVFHSMRWKIPYTKLLAFNPGDEFVGVDQRKGPQLIPKVIHQVWLGGKMPVAKDYFYQKTKKMYPDYQVKLWRNENITRENFPLTYDVMQTLIEFDKKSPYSKLATVTDILRHELLYHEGGFWKDAGMDLLRPVFDKFLTYKIAITVDKTFRYRWLQGMCFFANMPKLPHLWRITNFRNTNRMRIYHQYAMVIAGPIDFRNFIIGQEEYDPDILTMSYENTYPAQLTEHPEKDLCLKNEKEIVNQAYILEENGCYLIAGCEGLYPYSFGVQHNCFGNSWPNRRRPLL